jgi:type I restriction enzyme S subunit
VKSGGQQIDWEEVALGEIATLHRGYDLPSANRQLGEIPIISSSGLSGYHNVPRVAGPGVVTGRSGTLGRVFFIEESFWPLNTALFVSDFHGNDPRFVSYLLRCQQLEIHDGAAAVPSLNRNVVHRLRVRRPPLPVQCKIAAVLSAYDDLIENNNRRIKLLEEMAQRIYREWFVDFRYPGHEDVPLIDSELGPIPDGWGVQPFSNLGSFVNGFAFKPTDWGKNGLPIIKIRELKDGVSADTPRYQGDLGEKFAIRDGDVLFSWSADLDAYLWSGGKAWLNQHLFRVDPLPSVPAEFIFHALREKMPDFRNKAQGTTMRHIKRAALSQVKTAVAPEALLRRMAEVIAPIDQLSLQIARSNRNLHLTRDLLLPRLISGVIDVTDLEIVMAEVAA